MAPERVGSCGDPVTQWIDRSTGMSPGAMWGDVEGLVKTGSHRSDILLGPEHCRLHWDRHGEKASSVIRRNEKEDARGREH